MRILLVIAILVGSLNAFGQASVSGGGSVLAAFGTKTPWAGLHLGLEVPRDDVSSLYFRYTHHFSAYGDSIPADYYWIYVEPRDPNSILPIKYIGATPSMNYNILEGGVRYYIGDGYDFGWAGYGGSSLVISFNKIKMTYAPYDQTLYKLAENTRLDGSIFSLSFGLNGGVKYSTATSGTFYFDVSMAYAMLAQPSSNTVYTNMYRPLYFGFNLGYRRDLFL